MLNFGKQPNDNIGNSINTSNFEPLDCSGIFPLQIAQVTHKKGKSSRTGNDYEQLIVNAVVMNVATKQPIRSVSFSIFLSNTSQELQDFLYFTKQFDAEGNIVLYDYVTRTGQKRDGSGSFSIDEYKQFQGIKIIAMLEFKGMSDKGNPIFEVKGFVSQKGQSAAEVNANSAPTKYATTWKLLTNYLLPETNAQLFHPGWIPPAQQQAQAQQVYQQATQPQQPVYPQQGTWAPNAEAQISNLSAVQGQIAQQQAQAQPQLQDDDLPF